MKSSFNNIIDKIGNRINKMIYGLFHLINFKKSIIVLLFFIIIDIPLTYLSAQNLKAGQPYIGKWESTFELIDIVLFLLMFILLTIVNYPGKMSLKLHSAIVLGIIFFCIIGLLMMSIHLESIFVIIVIGLFLLIVISLLVISGLSEEIKQKFKLVTALGVGNLWTFVYWAITYFLNWYVLYKLFD